MTRGGWRRIGAWLLAGACLAAAGCTRSAPPAVAPGDSGSNASPDPGASDPAPKGADPAAGGTKPSGAGSEPRAAAALPADDPAAAVLAVARGWEQDDPVPLWRFLPPGQRRDVSDLVRDFAGSVDPEVWERSFAVARRAVRVLRTRRELVLRQPALVGTTEKPGPLAGLDPVVLAAHWDGLLAVAETIAESELADPGKARALDLDRFVERTGRPLLTRIRKLSEASPGSPEAVVQTAVRRGFADLRADLVAREGNTARVRLSMPDPLAPPLPGEEPVRTVRDVDFVRVEGHWIPQALREGWIREWPAWRQAVDSLPTDEGGARKRIWLDRLRAVDELLASLEAADAPDRFDAALAAGLPRVLHAFGAKEPRAAPVARGQDVALVKVVGMPDEAQSADLQDRLAAATDDLNEAIVQPVRDGDQLVLRVQPVRDAAEFAKRLVFAKVVSVEAPQRTVVVEWPPKPVP